MHEYEIHILGNDNRTFSFIASRHRSDRVAIATAHKIAGDRGFEVWNLTERICRITADEINAPRDHAA